MNINVHIENWYSKARYNTFGEHKSTAPVLDIAEGRGLLGMRSLTLRGCYNTAGAKFISSFWYSLIVAVGGGLKCQQDNTITGGVSQSMKHLQRCFLAPWDRSDVQDQQWDTK